jgi:hypothetical protein
MFYAPHRRFRPSPEPHGDDDGSPLLVIYDAQLAQFVAMRASGTGMMTAIDSFSHVSRNVQFVITP